MQRLRRRQNQHRQRGPLAALALAALGTFACGAAAQAQARYQVTVNTSTLNTTPGSLDFQFNPGGSGASPATVQITGFTSNGTLVGASSDSGGGTGALPGVLTISNNPGTNEVFQGFTFGTTLSFAVAFSSPAPASVGSLFGFTLFDGSGNQLLGGGNADGAALDVSVNANGSQTATPGSAAVTVTPAPVPEASEALSLGLLLVLGAGGLVAARRRHARA